METLQIGTITKQVPSTWNELGRAQLLDVLAEVHGKFRRGRRLRLLHLLTGFPLPLLATQPIPILTELLRLTNWLESEQHLLTEQLLPTLGVPGRHFTERPAMWHGPRGHLQNVLFGEFIFADTFFVLYCLHGTESYLDQFLTVLYRPARRVKTASGFVIQDASAADDDWNGDVRQAFNEHQLEARTPRVRHVAALEKMAVLTWYRGCRAELGQEFPDVFVAAEQDSPAPKQAPDWARVLRKLSGGAFGAVDQTAGQPLRLVLAEMQDLATQKPR